MCSLLLQLFLLQFVKSLAKNGKIGSTSFIVFYCLYPLQLFCIIVRHKNQQLPYQRDRCGFSQNILAFLFPNRLARCPALIAFSNINPSPSPSPSSPSRSNMGVLGHNRWAIMVIQKILWPKTDCPSWVRITIRNDNASQSTKMMVIMIRLNVSVFDLIWS